MRQLGRVIITLAFGWGASACGSDERLGEPGPLIDPPPAGLGVQLTTGDFSVPSGTEVQDCYFFRVGDLARDAGFPEDESLVLHRTQIALKPGSHHMNIFRVRTIHALDPAQGMVHGVDGGSECWNSANWADWPLLANSQEERSFDWTYPDGVGNELQPDEWLMLQIHYVNASTQKTPAGGRVDANLWTMPKTELENQIGTLFATNQSIRICKSNPTPKFQAGCQFGSSDPVHVIGANGHFHSRGKEFDIYDWDGVTAKKPPESARFYRSESWDEPPMAHSPELDVLTAAHGGIWYTCEYEWRPPPAEIGCDGLNALDKKAHGTPDSELDCCYTFGGVVDRAEHCNAFLYYYPKVDDVNCF